MISEKPNGNGLTLYHFPTSYYSQRVVVALHEKKLAFSSKNVSPLSMDQYKPWFLQLNPKGQVPVLQDGMRIVPDSGMIIEYLDDNFSNGSHRRLFPREVDAEVRQKIEHFRQLVDSVPAFPLTFGSLFHTQHVKNPGPPLSIPAFRMKMKSGIEQILEKISEVLNQPDLTEGLRSTLEEKQKKLAVDLETLKDEVKYQQILNDLGRVLDEIETHLAGSQDKPWLCSEEFTVADIYLSILLHRIRTIGLHEHFWSERPLISKYYSRAMQRDSVRSATKLPSLITAAALPWSLDKSYIVAICVGVALLVGCYLAKRK